MARYRALCSLGGSKPFTQLIESVGLANPFEPGCLDAVCDAVADTLDLQQ
jgi:oligoendopeptidase F